MVMQYWQREMKLPEAAVDPRTIHRDLYSPQARGVFASDLQQYLQRYGFRTFAFRGTWGDLEEHLAKGRPLIVALRVGRDLHYVVASGIDPQNNVLYKNDPAGRKWMKQHRAEFETQWRGASNWTLLAVPVNSPAIQ